MRTRLPHLSDPWLPVAAVAALFTDALGRIIVPGWGPVSAWAQWLLVAAFFACHCTFTVHHYTGTCDHCPSTDPAGKAAARRSRMILRALHCLTPLALLVRRLGGGPLAIGTVMFAVLVIAPTLLLGWIAPDGFALAFIASYFTFFHMAAYRHRQLGRWCPWCHHGGGGDGGHDHPEPDPDPVPTDKRDLTLAA